MNNNYSNILKLIDTYCSLHKISLKLEEKMSIASFDSKHGRHFISAISDLDVIALDNIAHSVVRLVYLPQSNKESDSPASVDAFLIDGEGKWYFIEFKNQKISGTKYKCIEKAYSNMFWLINILLEMKDKFPIDDFDYNHPFDFFKKNCEFILVIGNNCDDLGLSKYRECKKAHYPLPENCNFLFKLESYVFKKAIVYNETQFDELFVKNFSYE